MTKTDKLKQEDNRPLAYPLFYKDPVLLQAQVHADVGILPSTSFAFADQALSLPVCASEFAAAQRYYPIAFSASTEIPMPMVVTGIEDKQNLFVEKDGTWRQNTYVPAYVRRYPFIVMESPDKSQQMLMIDQASDRYLAKSGKSKATRLFDDEGQPTAAGREALGFCAAYLADYNTTADFANALKQANILTPSQANITFPDGRQHIVNDFLQVDDKAFRALPAKTVTDWHKRGWLDLIVLHLSSQLNWQGLIKQRAERLI
jgi:hypothetical protein